MENMIELSAQEVKEISGGSQFARIMFLVSPMHGLVALGIEEGIRQAAAADR